MKATRRPGKEPKIELTAHEKRILNQAKDILGFVGGNTDGECGSVALNANECITVVQQYLGIADFDGMVTT